MKKMMKCVLSVILCTCLLMTGCGVSEEALAALTADYEAKLAELESTLKADYAAKLAELETELDVMRSAAESVDDARDKGWIIVTDYVTADGKTDVTEALQKLINDNPRRTLYFPDGEYLLSSPINTPADPKLSVDLQLSNYAILRASKKWKAGEAVVRLGGISPSSSIDSVGTFYSLSGGAIDGNGVANGVAIVSGRETAIRDMTIKNTVVGIHIMRNPDYGSADADIYNVNIVGVRTNDAIGVLIQSHDNTLTNMRIAGVQQGIRLEAEGNVMRNIHPLYTGGTTYSGSYGFYDAAGSNWYDYCYSDQFRVGFYTKTDDAGVYDNCFCYWYTAEHGKQQTAFRAGSVFNSIVSNITVGFHEDAQFIYLLEVGKEGGQGAIEYAIVNKTTFKNTAHEPYLVGKLIVS